MEAPSLPQKRSRDSEDESDVKSDSSGEKKTKQGATTARNLNFHELLLFGESSRDKSCVISPEGLKPCMTLGYASVLGDMGRAAYSSFFGGKSCETVLKVARDAPAIAALTTYTLACLDTTLEKEIPHEFAKALVELKADCIYVDYKKNLSEAIKKIKKRIEEKTKSEVSIPYILGLDSSHKAIFVNVVHFKAKWQREFLSAESKTGKFFKSPFSDRNYERVPFMSCQSSHKLFHNEEKGYTVLIKPYVGTTAMMICLPTTWKQYPVVVLSASELRECLIGAQEFHKVHVVLPRFRVESTTKVLDRVNACPEWSAISRADHLTAEHRVFSVMHTCAIDVEEEGTTASAISAFEDVYRGLKSADEPQEFIANRPFTFYIVDTAVDVSKEKELRVLFAGMFCGPN